MTAAHLGPQVGGKVRTVGSFAGHSCMHEAGAQGYIAELEREMKVPTAGCFRVAWRIYGNNEDPVRPRCRPAALALLSAPPRPV